VITKADARKIVAKAIAESEADDVQVSLNGGRRTHLRFARNGVTTSGTDEHRTLSVTASFGNQSASASGNDFSLQGIVDVVRRAEAMAKLSPADPEHMPTLGPQKYVQVEAYAPTEDPEAMARGVKICTDAASKAGLYAAGFGIDNQNYSCVASKNGLFAWHKSSGAQVSTTVRTTDGKGSGWAAKAGNRLEDLDFDGLAATAVHKAETSANTTKLEPGTYVTILEPACVASLLGLLMGGVSARSAEEGRSFFSKPGGGNRLGEELFPKWLHVRSDPALKEAPVSPWTGAGLPRKARDWIRGGALRRFSRSRFWAKKTGRPVEPSGGNWHLGTTGETTEDLIATTERGVLITSLWYIRGVDPQSMLFTGLTRDGVFWIEDGKIARPVNNFRWNDSPVSVFGNALAVSKSIRPGGRGGRGGRVVVPALKTAKFALSSVSDAV